MKKAKDMLNTMVRRPIRRIRTKSAEVYDRYSDLFRSIKKLANPDGKEERKQ